MIPTATRQVPAFVSHSRTFWPWWPAMGWPRCLFRAFWPATRLSPAVGLPGLGLYLWLGLAMSGPIVLLRHGPRRNRELEPRRDSTPVATRTWAELAWLLIGIYWIDPRCFLHSQPSARIQTGRHDPIRPGPARSWPWDSGCLAEGGHRAGRGPPGLTRRGDLVFTWPVAWACLIVWGRVALRIETVASDRRHCPAVSFRHRIERPICSWPRRVGSSRA